jgi:tRNA 2-thiocytidine biosynthesis protein TtcA
LNRHLKVVAAETAGAPGVIAPDEVAPPLRATELGAFRYDSKLEMRIVRKMGKAIAEWRLLSPGDRVMVCCSGGKDSYALLDALLLWRRTAPIAVDVFAVNLDQGWPAYDTARIEAHLKTRGCEYHMLRAGIAPIVEEKLAPDATPCSLCSRLRRGVLYSAARELGATLIALGHHLDDLVETLLLNLFYSGQLKAMPPKLVSEDGRNVVIRPFAYVEERDLIAYAAEQRYPTVRCSCPTCGLPDQKRQVVKRMLAAMEEEHPGLKTQMLAALRNVRASHLLDRGLLARLAMNGAGGDDTEHHGDPLGPVAGPIPHPGAVTHMLAGSVEPS